MQGPPALGVRPAGDAEVAHYPEHFGKERNDVDTHQRSSGQSLSMRRAARSTERMCARTNGTSISAGLPLALRMASGPSAPSSGTGPSARRGRRCRRPRPPRRSARVRHWRWYTTRSLSGRPSSIRLLRAREGPARGLHGKSAQGFGQIAIGNARQLRHDRGALGTGLQDLVCDRPRRDNAPRRFGHRASQPPFRSREQHFGLRRVWLHLDPAFDAVGRSDAAQLDQIRRRRVGGAAADMS